MFSSRSKGSLPFLKTAAAVALACASFGALANSSASFAITSFGYSVTGGTLTFSATDAYQQLSAQASNIGLPGAAVINESDPNAVGFSAETRTATTSLASATVVGTTIPSSHGSATATTSYNSAYGTESNQSHAVATQSNDFTFSGTGSVTFNIGYTLNASSTSNGVVTAQSDNSYAISTLELDASELNGGAFGIQNVKFSTDGTANSPQSGFMTVTLNLTDGDFGSFLLSGTADAFAPSIPEPTDTALMLSGLGVLGLLAKRRRRA